MTEYSGTDSLTIDIADDGSLLVRGDIDMAGGPVLDAAILQRESGEPVVIDLREVEFIDSSGLRSLLEAARRARARGTEVVLRSVGPEVSRLLDITCTTDQFRMEPGHD